MPMPEVTSSQSPTPIACDPSAIPADARDTHLALAARLVFQDYQERRELPDGYAWRFAAEQYEEVAAYVANERRCCPFFTFTLEVGPAGGPVWLRVTGDDAIKAYLQSELATHAHLSA
jgi:hypothetical protein